VQEKYHSLDKEYEVEILLGLKSDSGDVLGQIESCPKTKISRRAVIRAIKKLRGRFAVPYPKFSSKTVNGKPLFLWTLEERLNEITIPIQEGYIYKIRIDKVSNITGAEIVKGARQKIRSLPTVTDDSKILGADFRRELVEITWNKFLEENTKTDFILVKVSCICSSGTYMRSLAEEIGKALDTCAIAYSIHRTEIGRRFWLPFGLSFWRSKF
jgi:tRNA pseudouridine(55) synthase